jgi:hypothetical protein
MTFADCISWGVFLHAVLHVVKDVLILQLLSTPSAIRCGTRPACCCCQHAETQQTRDSCVSPCMVMFSNTLLPAAVSFPSPRAVLQ